MGTVVPLTSPLLLLSHLVARAQWCRHRAVVVVASGNGAIDVLLSSSLPRASCCRRRRGVHCVALSSALSSSSSSSSLSPLQDGMTGRGDGTRRHEEWVAQIERAARVRIGRANKLGRHVSVNRSVGVLT